jgi:uncharacterized protein (DUF2384 family)
MAPRKDRHAWNPTTLQLKIKTVSPLRLERASALDAAKRLVRLFGNNQTAGILGVSPSQVSRWLRGESIGAQSTRRVLDIDFIFERARLVLHPEQAAAFFTFPQPHLNGARPIDVLVNRGVGPVIDALDRIDQGSPA